MLQTSANNDGILYIIVTTHRYFQVSTNKSIYIKFIDNMHFKIFRDGL